MRAFVFEAALVLACLGVTCASAQTVRTKHEDPTAGSGAGGWTMDYGVSGWKQDSTSKTFSNAGAGGVSSSTIPEASSASAGAVSSSTTNLPGLRPWALQAVRNDSDCIFVGQKTPTGNLWRPGCK